MDTKVYTVNDIQKLLGISRSKSYDFIRKVDKEKGPFRVIKIGSSYRIPKESFDKWINEC